MALTVLEFIKKPPRSPEAITIRCRVENNWTHTLRTLAPQGLNQENPKEFHSHRKSWSAHLEKTSLKVISITVWNYTRHCKNIHLHLKQFCYISSPSIRTPNIEDTIIRNVYLPSTRGISQKHHTGLLMCCYFQHTNRHILCRGPNDTRH